MRFDPSEFPRAFEQDEFFPAFQPIVELRTGQLAGFEVLARWQCAQRHLIPPDEFIALLETTGDIDRLTSIILKKASAAPTLAKSSVGISINLSPVQLLDYGLPGRIAEAAEQGGFPLDRLTLEITESALLDDLARAKAVAKELKSLRCRLALDDFGTGYSSLRHLHALPFDELKVDRGFVASMSSVRESRKIVASVIGLGQSLGMVTVAEGVETAEQADMLLWMGCDLAQGWLYGKPVGSEALEQVIAQERHRAALPAKATLNRRTLAPDGPPGQRLAQLQAIYDGAPVGLCLLDQKMRYVSLNRRLAQMNGIPAEAHLGRTVREIVPRVFHVVEPFIRRALSGEAVSGVEIPRPPTEPTGAARTLLATYQPVRDEAGEVLGVSVAVMDVTEHKRMQATLREVEDHYRTLVNVGSHVPWVLNTRGEVIETGRQWEDITGQPLAEALGEGWLQAVHPGDVAATRKAIHAALKNGGIIDIRYRLRQADGAFRWMHSRGAPRVSASGELLGFYGVVEDMPPAESKRAHR